MNEKKSAAIKEAYGDAWERVKDEVNGDGWLINCISRGGRSSEFGSTSHPSDFGFSYDDIDVINQTGQHFDWRPKSLKGIESNNGWVLTETRLPEVDQNINIILTTDSGYRYVQTHIFQKCEKRWFLKSVSHWKPVVSEKMPIY